MEYCSDVHFASKELFVSRNRLLATQKVTRVSGAGVAMFSSSGINFNLSEKLMISENLLFSRVAAASHFGAGGGLFLSLCSAVSAIGGEIIVTSNAVNGIGAGLF